MSARATEPKPGEATVVNMPRAEKSMPRAEAPQTPPAPQAPPQAAAAPVAAPKKAGRRRLILMIVVPLVLVVGGGLVLADRRPLRGHRQRLCGAGQGVAVSADIAGRITEVERRREPVGQGRRRAVHHRSGAVPDRARPGECGAGRRRVNVEQLRSPTAPRRRS